MYCPGCGIEITPEQQFCRQCGFRLEKVMELFAEASALLQKQKKIDRSIALAAGGFAASALLALLIGIIYQIILVKGDVIPGLILV